MHTIGRFYRCSAHLYCCALLLLQMIAVQNSLKNMLSCIRRNAIGCYTVTFMPFPYYEFGTYLCCKIHLDAGMCKFLQISQLSCCISLRHALFWS